MARQTLLTKDFTRHVEQILVPLFIEYGFSQYGIDHYCRYNKPFIHCIWLQERSDMDAMCVNMGVHLDFIPIPGKPIFPVTDVREMDCCIRVRLAPRGEFDYWWQQRPAKQQVESIRRAFEEEGVAFFRRYTEFPGAFATVAVEDIESGDASSVLPEKSWVGMAVLLAQINERIKNRRRALEFAGFGLQLLEGLDPRHVRATKKLLNDIISGCID